MRRAALLCAWLLVAAGCRTLPAQLTPLPPGDARPRLFLEALDAQAAERRALRGRAQLAVDGDAAGVHIRGSQVLVMERPDRLRVEVLGFLNQTEAVLVTGDGRYEFFVAGDRSYRSGLVYPGLLWDVARIDLEPREVVELVLGTPLPDRSMELSRARGTQDGGVWLELTDGSGDARETLVFDAKGRLRSMRRQVRGEPVWEARFDDYAPVAGTPFAHAITLEFQGSRTSAELSLRDVELNPALPDGLFELQVPE